MTSTNTTTTTTDQAVLDGIATVTASTLAVQAVLDLIEAEDAVEAAVRAEVAAKDAAKAAKAEVKAAAERVDDRLEAACPQVITALASGVSQRSLAADLKAAGAAGWSKDRIAMAISVGTALDLPGETRGGALRTAWDNANRAKGVGRPAIAAVLKASETREDVLQGWEALVNPPVVEPETGGDDDTDEVEVETATTTDARLVVAMQSIASGFARDGSVSDEKLDAILAALAL